MKNAVLLINPKYPHNVGGALRACAVFGIPELRWTGDRVTLWDPKVKKKYRLPREERMRGYNENVNFGPLMPHETLYLLLHSDLTPVGIEVRNDFRSIVGFDHPENALYVFGPEDASIGRNYLSHCHHHIYIPAHFCLNLAACVNVVLYDRLSKRLREGKEEALTLREMLSRPDLPDARMMAGFDGN